MQSLIIAYDLMRDGQNYEAVEEAIDGLGEAVNLQQTLFCVQTSKSMQEAYDLVRAVMDENDKLIVIETSKFLSSTHGGKIPMEL
jgi:hypothetical protein